MPTPFANAAKRGVALNDDPITVAPFSEASPVASRYFRTIGPVSAIDPASASPRPSRIDFRASSITGPGISGKRISRMNRATYSVACGSAVAPTANESPRAASSAPTANIVLRASSRRVINPSHFYHLRLRFLTNTSAAGHRIASKQTVSLPERSVYPEIVECAADSVSPLALELVLAHSWNPIAYQILNPGIRHWFSRANDAVVGYVPCNRVRVAAGAPICRPTII